jgi:hypothetical protein
MPSAPFNASNLTAMAQAGLVGLIAGFTPALALSQWVWLEMRVNTGLIIPAGALTAVLLAARLQARPRPAWLLTADGLLAVTLLACFGRQWDAWLYMPAHLLREGCLLQKVPLGAVNWALGTLLLLGHLLWLADRGNARAAQAGNSR